MRWLRKLRDDLAVRTGVPGRRLVEYGLMAGYSGVAILAVLIGSAGKAGTLAGRAGDPNNYTARVEMRALLKQLAITGGDLSAGVLLLGLGIAILWWGRRGKVRQREALDPPLPSGPPFYL